MKSGLYALAGDSATATAAACANRFDEPMTNVSKVYFGLRRLPVSVVSPVAPRRSSRPVPMPLPTPRADSSTYIPRPVEERPTGGSPGRVAVAVPAAVATG